jgi:hypothetical protein
MANIRVLTKLDNISTKDVVTDKIVSKSIFINEDILFIDNNSNKIGINNNNPQHELHVKGSFAATTKSFIIDHPLLPDTSYSHLRYGSLESPYHGIRLTGKDVVKDGICTILLPIYISKLVSNENINIQLTNYKHDKILFVDNINIEDSLFIVKSYNYSNLEFFWTFTAIRTDVDPMVVEF